MIILRRCLPAVWLLLAGAVCWAQKPELVVQTGHSLPPKSVAFSPDGKMLASGGGDNNIKFWDLDSGTELRTLTGHSDEVNAVTFNPNGKILASGSSDHTIKLWEVATGRELHVLKGHNNSVSSIAFSPDGKILASGGWDGAVKLWEVSSGRELRTFPGSSGQAVTAVAFSPDGKKFASAGPGDIFGNTIRLWDVSSGLELRSMNWDAKFRYSVAVAFSPDGKMLASGSYDATILWDVSSGNELRTFTGSWEWVRSVAFSPDGKMLASGSLDNTIRLWDVASGSELHALKGHFDEVNSVAFSPDGKMLTSASDDNTIKLWDVSSGSYLRTLKGHSIFVSSVTFSPDGKTLAFGNWDLKLWNLNSGRELRSLTAYSESRTLSKHSVMVGPVAYSPDGKILASGNSDNTIELWDLAGGKVVHTLTGHFGHILSVTFSPDGRTLASSGFFDKRILLWDVASGQELHSLTGDFDWVGALGFSPDGKMLVSSSGNTNSIRLWDVVSGRELHRTEGCFSDAALAFSPDGKTLAIGGSCDKTLKLLDVSSGSALRTFGGDYDLVDLVAFSPDGKTLASGSRDNTIRLWHATSGRELIALKAHSQVSSIAFSPDGQYLVAGYFDGTIKVWDINSGKELADLIALDQNDWLIVDSSGRFDASPGAQKLMSWRVGTGLYDLITLEQLKERYYEPGLLSKILGFNKEPRRDVSKFENPKLNPDVNYKPLPKGSSQLTVMLINRGGGLGRVQVFVNGKEFLADARDDKLKRNPNVATATLNIDLSKATGVVTGKENDVRVVAWNVENYISSRGSELVWTPDGPADRAPPEVYAIVGGISNYSGSQLNLNFAAKDAIDIANAIELGAKRLFGADKVHLSLLSTADDPRAIAPTKENFTKAFEGARKAKPTDILIVYLAGHGITLQRGSDTYCYLTEEARTTDTAALSDSGVRKQETITSEELVDWIKQIPALKQVVMLDTCAAGAAQAQLKLVDKREASGDAIRAIDRAKDRTGSYILMGSAADAVSYEASQYGQGLLTYALLKGLKGAALRNDEFIDVSKLFLYAREEVEQLAKNIGGIQRPIIFSPKDDSFEVGQLNKEDKLKIFLATPKPMILRPRFLDAQADDDTLDLMKVLRARLRDESFVSARGGNQSVLVFVDDEEFPGGIRPTGRYTIQGNNVTVTLRLRRDGVEIGSPQTITGTKEDVSGLAAKTLDAVKEGIKKLP